MNARIGGRSRLDRGPPDATIEIVRYPSKVFPGTIVVDDNIAVSAVTKIAAARVRSEVTT
jgi:hypothetical protein